MLGLSGGVLVDGQQGGCAAAFDKYFADAMAGGFGSDHRDIDVRRRGDRAESDVEAVGKHQRLAGGQVGSDFLFVDFTRDRVRHQNHDDVGPGRHFGGTAYGQAAGFGFGA